MKYPLILLVTASFLATGCTSTCGEHQYATPDGGLFVGEDCSPFGGSHGSLYAFTNLASLTLDFNTASIAESVSIIYDLTPYSIVFFRADHLEEGTVLDMGSLSGLAIHDPTATGQLPVQQDLLQGSLEVLAGPRGPDDEPRYKLAWDVTFGDDFQIHRGEKWIEFLPTNPNLLPVFEYPADYDDIVPTGPCAHEGDLRVASQEALEAALPLCSVSGTLTLTGSVTDSAPLAELVSVGGLVVDRTGLADLDGLAALSRVEGDVHLTSNDALTRAVTGLSTVGGAFVVEDHPQLWEVSVPRVDDLTLSRNAVLETLPGLDAVTSLDWLEVRENAALETFSAPSLTTLERASIAGNGALTTLAFPQLVDVGALEVADNGLADLDGLSALEAAESLTLRGDLHDLSGLDGLQRVTGRLTLSDLPMGELSGFGGLTSLGDLSLTHAANLTSVTGFPALTSVVSVTVTDNPALVTLGGFTALESVDRVVVRGNDALEDLDLLVGPATVGQLRVESSPSLQRVVPEGAVLAIDELVSLHNGGLALLGNADVGIDRLLEVEGSPALTSLGADVAGRSLASVRLVDTGLSGLGELATATDIGLLTVGEGGLQDLGLAGVPVGFATLSDLPQLTSLAGLSAGGLSLLRTGVVDVDGLDVSGLASVQLEDNGALTSVDGLGGLVELDLLVIDGSPSLTALPPFTDLERADLLWLEDTGVAVLGGFPSLEVAVDGLHVRGNGALTSLDGFGALTTAGNLVVRDNPALASLAGFGGLTSVGTTAEIVANPSLCVSAAEGVLDRVQAVNESSVGNLPGC